jgi:hypothetical protein
MKTALPAENRAQELLVAADETDHGTSRELSQPARQRSRPLAHRRPAICHQPFS